MSEDKTQNGYEGSQELDFQDAKEMTVGEAVRKEAEINAGVTETDSILDKYIKQHREEVASQKFSKKIEADGDTSPLDAFIQKQRQEFADSGLIGQSMANESINSTTATEEVTPVTFGFGATDNKADETQSHIDKQLPNAPVEPEVIAEPESQSSEVIITSTNADRFITSETEKFDLGDALADSSTSTNQPAYNDALVDNIDDNNPLIANIDDPEPQNPAVANIDDTEPQASKPLLDDAAISDTIDLAAIASTVAGVTGAKADEEKTTPKVSMAVNRPSAEDRISSESISPSHKSAFDGDIPVYRRKGVVIGALAVLALAIIGGSYALYKGTHSQSAKTTSTASSAVTSSSSKDTSAADNKAFEEMYKNFFTDDEQTKLANDQFGKLSDLEKLLKKLEKTKYYDAAKKKYDNLKKQIEAVQKINSQFESDALVDGSYNASIAHVGGSYDALIRARDGHHRDMDQFFNDGTFWRSRDRYAPHNVYTTTNNLHQLAQKYNWNSSNFQGFSHRNDNKKIQKDAKQVNITISGYLYNSSYNYNQECNCYLRNQAGSPHLDREKGQISPKVLIAMKINNGRASDGYHTNYQTIGSGEAIVFQEGKAMAVEWHKDSENSPLYFKKDGKNFEFISGQKWIVAIGNYDGNMSWQ